jgi:hypothetical protein
LWSNFYRDQRFEIRKLDQNSGRKSKHSPELLLVNASSCTSATNLKEFNNQASPRAPPLHMLLQQYGGRLARDGIQGLYSASFPLSVD